MSEGTLFNNPAPLQTGKYYFGHQLVISLTMGKFATIDLEDAELVGRVTWCASRWEKGWAARGRYRKHFVSMHRFIIGAGPDQEVDHIDGHTLNNRRSNLRIADASRNQGNRASKTGRFKGVQQAGSRWLAVIHLGKNKYLGTFDTAEEAAKKYDDAARSAWGEFACVNYPKPGERSAITGEIIPAPILPVSVRAPERLAPEPPKPLLRGRGHRGRFVSGNNFAMGRRGRRSKNASI